MAKSKTRCIGILTAGGDCPGLNAAIRAVAKPAISRYGMKVVGILDGFRGLVENRILPLESEHVSGILTLGGTLLGTSRDKPHRMLFGGEEHNMIAAAAENLAKHHIDCLVCLGGGGTQKNALRLMEQGGVNVVTLPKTIDNDVARTDTTFGYDTALTIATEAIDRLHTTATSHHRLIVCEIMGNKAGWLALSAGIAGGADVILIPEIPYDLAVVAEYLTGRRRSGKRFSIVAIAEGARSREQLEAGEEVGPAYRQGEAEVHLFAEPMASRLTRRLQELTGIEARVTSLGHVQRGGSPTAADRLLCTRLGTRAAEFLADGEYNVMVGVKREDCVPIPLKKVAGKLKAVPLDHPMVRAAKLVGTCLGDE